MAAEAIQPLPRTNHAAVGVGSKLYVWGGDGRSATIPTPTLEIFDVPSVSWEEPQRLHGSDMPDAGLEGMAVTSDGEVAYSFGGVTGSYPFRTYHNTLYNVTPSHSLYHKLQPTSFSHTLPRTAEGSCIVQFQDKLLLHGGSDNITETNNELHVFDIKKS